MSVTWVAGSTAAFAEDIDSITAAAPVGIAAGDTLLAAVYGRSALTTPAGWTKLAEPAPFTGNSFTQRLAVFSKNVVTAADAGAAFTFQQASWTRIGVVYAVLRGVDDLTIATAVINNTSTYLVAPAPLAAAADGSLVLVFASSVLVGTGGGTYQTTPTAPPGFTLTSGAALAAYRLAAARRTLGAGQSNSGSFDFSPGESAFATNGLAAVTVLAGASLIPPVEGRAAADSPLGQPAILGRTGYVGRASAPSPLGRPSVLALHDFSAHLGDAITSYLMEVTTPAGQVRIPIASWQATLQADAASYVQCVVPACAPWVDVLTEATAFQIIRSARAPSGAAVLARTAVAPLQTLSLAQGSANYSATLSGYTEPAAGPSGFSRPLTEIRTIFTYASGYRVRCAVDWLLQPGHTATFDGIAFPVRYISYYVNDDDAFMDVGQ